MGRPRKNGRLSCGSNQLGLDTKPRGKGVNDLYEKYAIQVSPPLASDRVLKAEGTVQPEFFRCACSQDDAVG
jgi:hypothetical protein